MAEVARLGLLSPVGNAGASPVFVETLGSQRIGRASMGLAEALSDDGSVTGRMPDRAWRHHGGGMLHTFPFLISSLAVALDSAYAVAELLLIAFIRFRFVGTFGPHQRPGYRRRRNCLRHRNLVGLIVIFSESVELCMPM